MCIVVNLAMKRFCNPKHKCSGCGTVELSVLPYSFGGLRYVWQRICFVLQSVRANATEIAIFAAFVFTSTGDECVSVV
jgi:hypothetical protein